MARLNKADLEQMGEEYFRSLEPGRLVELSIGSIDRSIEPIWDLVEKINSREGVGEHSMVEGSQPLWGMEYLGDARRHEMSGILGSGQTKVRSKIFEIFYMVEYVNK